MRRIRVGVLVWLMAGVALAAGWRVQDPAGATPDQIEAWLDDGNFDRAESEARSLVSRLEVSSDGDPERQDAALDLLVAALLANGRGGVDDTVALALRTLNGRERRLGMDSPALLPALQNATDALVAAARYDEAIAHGERAVALSQRRVGPDSVAVPIALDHLGRAQLEAGRLDDALRSLQRSRALLDQRPDAPPRPLARTLEDLGAAWQRKGDYAAAGEALRRARAIHEARDAAHPGYARVLGLIADQSWFEGHLVDAKATGELALAIASKSLRADHPTVAAALRDLGATLADIGDLQRSLELKLRAHEIAERNFGSLHHVTAEYLNGLGVIELRTGNYVAARRHMVAAVDLFERHYGSWHQNVATALTVLAVIDARLGAYGQSQRELGRAIAIHSRAGGRNHPFVALALTELAIVLNEEGRPGQALPLLERAQTIRETNLGRAHRDVARTLADLAATLAALGHVTRAQRLATRAVRIWEALDAPDAPEFASVLTLYADLQARRGDFVTSRDVHSRALAIRDRAFGTAHPLYADGQVALAGALAHLGDGRAADLAAAAETAGREHLRLMLRSLPERQALQYAAARPRGLNLVLTLAGTDASAVRGAADSLIRSRALVLDEMAARRGAALAPGDGVEAAWTAMNAARQRVANLLVRGPGTMPVAQYTAIVDAARRESELAEEGLAERSAAFRTERSRAQLGVDEVTAALPADAALVAFAHYDRTPLPSTTGSTPPQLPGRDVPSYLAFVLRSGQSPVAVRLGASGTIDRLVSAWRADIAAEALAAPAPGVAPASSRPSGAILRRRIWDPLVPHLGDARRVFIVPDGALSLIPFAALPIGRRSFLLERGPVLHYLTAERDLVPAAGTRPAGHGLLGVGGAAFDDGSLFRARARPLAAAPTTAPATGAPSLRGVGSALCAGLQTIRFQPLNGTRQELRDVSDLWGANAEALSGPARLLLGRDASEAAIKRDARGHRVLHLATHGFFLDGGCAPPAPGTRGVGGLATTRSRAVDNPLQLSGLALAGANRRALAGPDEDDGILTADEVSGLDLEGVEWAVLSACDTGVGEIRPGEGVFGLRRAFQVAGARTVVMSLWSVDDQAARAWMRALYRGRFERRLSTADAVHQAGLSVLRDRRARGLSTHPFYWAAFVAAGDWR